MIKDWRPAWFILASLMLACSPSEEKSIAENPVTDSAPALQKSEQKTWPKGRDEALKMMLEQFSQSQGPAAYRGQGVHALLLFEGLQGKAWMAFDADESFPEPLAFRVDAQTGMLRVGDRFGGHIRATGNLEGVLDGRLLVLEPEDPAHTLSGYYSNEDTQAALLETGHGQAWIDLDQERADQICALRQKLNFEMNAAVSQDGLKFELLDKGLKIRLLQPFKSPECPLPQNLPGILSQETLRSL